MKHDKRPISGYVLDHTKQYQYPEHRCDTCGNLTSNYSQVVATGETYDELCDSCLYEFYPHVNW